MQRGRENEKNSRQKRSITLVVVTLLVFVGTVVAIASLKEESRFDMKKMSDWFGTNKLSKLSKQYALLKVSEDGWATSQTGVFYVPGDPSRCFIIKSSPHGAQRGWNLEPSDALAPTMISAFAWVGALNPTRGKVMIWNGAKQRKEVKFVYMGTSIQIDGVLYDRRPKVAPWECKPKFTTKIPVYAKSFGAANCQWLMLNQNTGGFVVEYTSGPGNIIGGGGGYYVSSTNTGQVGGYHHSGALDGVYDLKKQANPPVFMLYIGPNRFAGGAWDFVQLGTCADPGYPTVTQQVGALPTYPTIGVKVKDSQYRVTPQASWSQAAVACLKDGLTLCTKQEYCPGGTGSQPELGRLIGDEWAPIADTFQNYVQLADPNRICSDHLTRHFVLPHWEYYGSSINTVFRCCVKPPHLSGLSIPMQQLILNDAEYRYILDETFVNAEQVCTSEGMHLCTLLEYCPNGPGSLPLLGAIPGGDVWAPITDSRFPTGNNWVQVSDLGRICHTHKDLYNTLPSWTSCCTAGKKTPFRCCH